MPNVEKILDPIWDYTLNARLVPYIPSVRKFWDNIASINVTGTGVYVINGVDVPPGLMYRVTNTPVRSPIKNVQVFPFVPTSYLNIVNVAGGVTKMVSRVCANSRFKIDEFTIVEKANLPSTYHQGQFLAFVPTNILNSSQSLGKWVYLTVPEMTALAQGVILKSVLLKVAKYNLLANN